MLLETLLQAGHALPKGDRSSTTPRRSDRRCHGHTGACEILSLEGALCRLPCTTAQSPGWDLGHVISGATLLPNQDTPQSL